MSSLLEPIEMAIIHFLVESLFKAAWFQALDDGGVDDILLALQEDIQLVTVVAFFEVCFVEDVVITSTELVDTDTHCWELALYSSKVSKLNFSFFVLTFRR